MSVMLFGGIDVDLLGVRVRATTPQRLLIQFVVVFGVLLAVSPRMRSRLAQIAPSPVVFFFAATVLAIWLSLGPMPNAGAGNLSGIGIYSLLYDYVPGFNGVRVPARYAMLAGLFLAVMAGYGARSFLTFNFSLLIASFLILLEGAAIPFEINRTWNMHEATPPPRVMPAAQAPPVYARIAALPAGSAITEFPFGDGAWEIRYLYYAAAHWKPITNGYSGGFPPRYKERVAHLQRIAVAPEAAWQSLRDAGTTHVVVHRNAFANQANADIVESWLKAHGAKELERFADGDILFAL
jgi:hypothetical protein